MKINRKKLVIGLSLLVVAISFIAMKFAFKTTEYDFTTVRVQKGMVSNTITATGTLQATNTVVVGTQVSGVIEKLFVDFNSKVTKGQLIAELDKITLQSTLETAEAELEKALAKKDYQEASLERNKILFSKELLANSDYDLIVYDYKTSMAELKSAQANLDKAQRNLSYASIYSPIDGIVLNRAVEEGQTVTASMSTPELYTITNDLSTMQVEADIDEADIGQLELGQRVEFNVDAFSDLTFDGKVSEIRLQPTESSNVITYTTIVTVNNPDLKLKPGMTASIVAYVEEVNDVLVLAAKALRFTPDQEMLADYIKSLPEELQLPAGRPQGETNESFKLVWVKDGSVIRPARIEIGADDGTSFEVVSGLDEGVEVICTMVIGTRASSKNSDDGDEEQKSPFIQESPGGRSGGGPPR